MLVNPSISQQLARESYLRFQSLEFLGQFRARSENGCAFRRLVQHVYHLATRIAVLLKQASDDLPTSFRIGHSQSAGCIFILRIDDYQCGVGGGGGAGWYAEEVAERSGGHFEGILKNICSQTTR